MKLASHEEISFNKAHAALDLAFCLRAIRSAKSRYKAIMLKEILKIGIPDRIRGHRCSLDHNLLHVVIKDLSGIASKIMKCIHVTLNEGMNIDIQGKLDIPHAGISKGPS